jgi:release factor glutamine methyltransferase
MVAVPTSPPAPRTVGSALADATATLRAAGVPGPRLDALLLLGHVLGASKPDLLAHPERPLDAFQDDALSALVGRRAAREPLAHILGAREFYGRDFRVTPAVLVPRPETELLVEQSLEWLRASPRATDDRAAPLGVDVGAGSGAIAVSLAAEQPGLRILAVDRSSAALAVARENAARHGVAERVALLQGDLLAAVRGSLPLIVANLPYVPTGAIDGLMPEVARHEPRQALDGGLDGLELNRRLLAEAEARLAAPGLLLLEMGEEQAQALREQVRRIFPTAEVAVLKDLAGHDRVLRVERR